MGPNGPEPGCSGPSLGKAGKLLPQTRTLLADNQGCAFDKGPGGPTDDLVPANLTVQWLLHDLAARNSRNRLRPGLISYRKSRCPSSP